MKITTLKERADILELAKSLTKLIDQGYPVQVMTSPVQGVFRTQAQNSLYYKYLHRISIHTGETVRDLDGQVREFFFNDPEIELKTFSIEEFDCFLSQFIAFAEEEFGCLVNQDTPTP